MGHNEPSTGKAWTTGRHASTAAAAVGGVLLALLIVSLDRWAGMSSWVSVVLAGVLYGLLMAFVGSRLRARERIAGAGEGRRE